MKTITGNKVIDQNLIAYHVWGTYKGENISDFIATSNPDLVFKLYPHCKKLYASVCSISLNQRYKLIN